MNFYNEENKMMLDISSSNSQSKIEELLGRPLNRAEIRLRRKDEKDGRPENKYLPEKKKILLVCGPGAIVFSEKEKKFVLFLESQCESYIFVSNDSANDIIRDVINNDVENVYCIESCPQNVVAALLANEQIRNRVKNIPDVSANIPQDVLLQGDMFVSENLFD